MAIRGVKTPSLCKIFPQILRANGLHAGMLRARLSAIAAAVSVPSSYWSTELQRGVKRRQILFPRMHSAANFELGIHEMSLAFEINSHARHYL